MAWKRDVLTDHPAAPSRLARLTSYALAGSATTQLLGALAGILSARLLGPEGKGLLVLVLLWPGLLAALGGGLGLEEAAIHFTARAPARAASVLSAATALAAGQALLLTCLGWLLVPVLIGRDAGALVPDARLYLAWVALSYFTLTPTAMLQGSLRFTALNVLRPVVVAGILAGLSVLALAGAVSLHRIVLVYLVANAAALALAWLLALRIVRPVWPDGQLFKPLLAYAAKAQVGHIAGVANERLDLLLLAVSLSPSALGLYAAGLSLSAALRLFGSSFALVALPALARRRSSSAAVEDIGRLCRATVYSSLAAGAILVVSMPAAVEHLFGPSFAGAALPAQILVGAVAALNAARVLCAGFKGLGLPEQASYAEGIGTAVTLALMLALVPPLGLIGAALAAALSWLATLGYLAWAGWRRLGMAPVTLVVPTSADLAWLQAAGFRLLHRPLPASA